MVDWELEQDERIICGTREAWCFDGETQIELTGLFLTNKSLISVYEKSLVLFSKKKVVVDKKPLSLIRNDDDIIQVKNVKDENFGESLQVLYSTGEEDLYSFGEAPKSEYHRWEKCIKQAIIDNGLIGMNTGVLNLEPISKKYKDQQNKGISLGGETPNTEIKFCKKCGAENNIKARFCQRCGRQIDTLNELQNAEKLHSKSKSDIFLQTERRQEFAGKIVKCPNCGEILKSFVTCCPTCGYELREIEPTMSIKEFVAKLEQIEGNRKEDAEDEEQLCKTDLQKINLIRSFSVPNTKEDLIEFFTLAASNVNENYGTLSDSQEAVSYAWEAKYEQVYQKAIICFGDTPEIKAIKKLYSEKKKNLNKKNKHISRVKKAEEYLFAIYIIISLTIFALALVLIVIKNI